MSQSQIVNPSKYDIIPLHTSDRATFKSCRRRWNWSSPARQNLTRKVSVFGVYVPYWFGTGIHYAVQKYYDPEYSEDCVVAFQTWYNMQVNGGPITEAELAEYADREPVKRDDGLYWVKGLSDLMPDYDPEEFAEYLDLGTGMMTYYKEYAPANDDFTIIAVEQTFSVPVLDEMGEPMYMVDTREMPEGWEPDLETENVLGHLMVDGPQGIVKQVHARGRIDAIIRNNHSGKYGIADYKTASKIDDDYFRHLDLDEQVTTYSWAAECMAIMHDLPYQNIDFIMYQAMLKAYPKPPTKTTRGLLSIDRQKESTTAEMFAEAIDILGQRALFEADEKMQAYYAWLLETEDKRFVNRYTIRRNKFQKYNCGRRLYFEAMDMLNPNVYIYPNPTKDYGCLNCWFRSPCVMVEDGSDFKSLLKDGFQLNYDR